jgi:glucokinase
MTSLTNFGSGNGPSPNLIADVGGTFVRFALETAPGRFEKQISLACADFPDLFAAITAYINQADVHQIAHAALAIANPIDGDHVRMTNHIWEFSIEALRQQLGLQTLVVVNDFTALAMAVPRLTASQRVQIGSGQAREDSVIGVLGAGSGLGVSGVIPSAQGWIALGTEGGHVSAAPVNEQEIALLQFAWHELGHVSFERLLSTSGLELIYRALAAQARVTVEPLAAKQITARALAGQDRLCVAATDQFCSLLGTASANLALTLGALGGIYIGGGIVPSLGDFFTRSSFRKRFESKGRFSQYLRDIPTYVISDPSATLRGTATILSAQLKAIASTPSSGLIDRVRLGISNLSTAEERVAQYFLANTRKSLSQPVADIAEAAGVSQPTVIRFCRSMGCDGLADFKLQLASELRGTLPITHAQVTDHDSIVEMGVKVLGNTASAILTVRERLNRLAITQAVRELDSCTHAAILCLGADNIAAQDLQLKLLRVGIPSSVYADASLIALAVVALTPSAAVIVLSADGQSEDLVAAARLAQSRSNKVIGLCPTHCALALNCDVLLAVDHAENNADQMPMISRVLQLLVIDILTLGVVTQRQRPDQPNAATGKDNRKTKNAPGVSAAHSLANLSSHGRLS